MQANSAEASVVQANRVDSPNMSPTQRDSTTTVAGSPGPGCADLSAAPSDAPKAAASEGDGCTKSGKLPHEATMAAVMSQEVKVCDEKASQTEDHFRRTDTCITQEVSSSA